jgi:hypothetical protein
MGRWRIVNGLLVVIVALLGFEIARTWARALPPVQVPTTAAPGVVDPGSQPVHEKGRHGAEKAAARAQQAPAVLVAAITEKDLFDQSRHPPAPDEMKVDAAPPPVTKPPDNVTVVGVRIFGKDREVFVNDASATPAVGRRLRAGDQIAGYTIKAIEPTAVSLVSPSGDIVALPLTLDKGKGPGQPARAPTPARPPQAQAAQASPAAGAAGSSPAAGVAVKPATPAVPPAGAAAAPGQAQPRQLPTEVQQKLDQIRKQNEKRAGRRH